jgi:hypothetical protein
MPTGSSGNDCSAALVADVTGPAFFDFFPDSIAVTAGQVLRFDLIGNDPYAAAILVSIVNKTDYPGGTALQSGSKDPSEDVLLGGGGVSDAMSGVDGGGTSVSVTTWSVRRPCVAVSKAGASLVAACRLAGDGILSMGDKHAWDRTESFDFVGVSGRRRICTQPARDFLVL